MARWFLGPKRVGHAGYFELASVFFFELADLVADLVDRADLLAAGFLEAAFFAVGFFAADLLPLVLFGDGAEEALAVVVGLTAATVMSAGVEVSCFDEDLVAAAICLEADLGPSPRMTSDWPGKISGRRRLFARMSAAVVVLYLLAMLPRVSPERTT